MVVSGLCPLMSSAWSQPWETLSISRKAEFALGTFRIFRTERPTFPLLLVRPVSCEFSAACLLGLEQCGDWLSLAGEKPRPLFCLQHYYPSSLQNASAVSTSVKAVAALRRKELAWLLMGLLWILLTF